MRTRIILIILLVESLVCRANIVINPGFEAMESIGIDLPDSYGDWDGDDGVIVTEENGIVPFEGEQMLRFDATTQNGASSATTCEIYQILDIAGYEDLISGGNAIASGSINFNRIAGDAQTDTHFGMVLMAYDGSPSTFPTRWVSDGYDSSLAWEADDIYSDSDPLLWEEVSCSLHLPTDTTFLVVKIAADEDIFNDYSYPELDGHYADASSVEIVPEPGTICLLGFGILGLLRRRKS